MRTNALLCPGQNYQRLINPSPIKKKKKVYTLFEALQDIEKHNNGQKIITHNSLLKANFSF